MPECILCGSKSFYGQDGLYFCDECNTQSQDVREEVEAEENFEEFHQTNAIRRQVKKKGGRGGRKSVDIDRGKVWLTFEGYQCLIKRQVQELIKLGVDPSLKDIVGQLWFGFLERLGIAFTGSPEGSTIPVELMKRKRDKQPGTTDSPIPGKIPRSVSVRKNGKHEEDIEPEEWENESFYDDDDPMKAIAYNKIDDLDAEMEKQLSGNDSDDGKDGSDKESARGSLSLIVAKKKGINEKVSQMSQQHTLALIYLGLLWLNEPVSLNDLVRLVKEGHLSYHKASSILPPHMKFANHDAQSLQDQSTISVKYIHQLARKIAMNVLKLPPIPKPDMNITVAKLCLDLEIPSPIHRLAVVVMNNCRYEPMTAFKKYRKIDIRCNLFYEEMAMAFIIVALKFVYGLDGCKERNAIVSSTFLDIRKEQIESWGSVALRLHQKRAERTRNSIPWREDQLPFVNNQARYAEFCSKEFFKCWVPMTSLQKDYHRTTYRQSRFCREDYKDEYSEIFRLAGKDLSGMKEEIVGTIKPTSFPCSSPQDDKLSHSYESLKGKHVPASHSINSELSRVITTELTELTDSVKETHNQNNYCLYPNSSPTLNVHDWYKFLLGICGDRLEITPTELQGYVEYAESALFENSI